jgi:hypothetical protein
VLVADKDGKDLNRYMHYCTEAMLFDATFRQDISPRKIGFPVKDFPDKNIAVFNLTYLCPEQAALFVRYGAKSYFDLSGSGSFWRGLKTVLRGNSTLDLFGNLFKCALPAYGSRTNFAKCTAFCIFSKEVVRN